MKTTVILLILLAVVALHAQTPDVPKIYSVRSDAPKSEEAFTKQFLFVVESAAGNFERVPKQFSAKEVDDTTFILKDKLPGANEATITKSREKITWSERFPFWQDMMGMYKLLQKVKAALPEDFVYTKTYDPATRISDYTFFKAADSKVTHQGFPEEIHLNGDAVSGYLTIVRAKE